MGVQLRWVFEAGVWEWGVYVCGWLIDYVVQSGAIYMDIRGGERWIEGREAGGKVNGE